ncbi:MAG: adenosine kinase [Pseudomonadota bacterium]|nr:adenosine kinase [Pseudomonadota bacterium]
MSDTPFDVTGVGNAIVDVITSIEESELVRLGLNKGTMTLINDEQAAKLYQTITNGVETSGGSAANTMAGIASLGGQGAYFGKVTDDVLGRSFVEDLNKIGVIYPMRPAVEGPSTARCLVFVTPDAERTMQTYLGVSIYLNVDDIDPETIGSSKITYLEGYLFDRDEAKEAFIKAAELAHFAGRKVALTLSDPFCVERHRKECENLIASHVDILFANQDEITGLFEVTSLEYAIGALGNSVEVAAITRGEKGSVIKMLDEVVEIPPAPVDKVVDTTGAGDLFAAGVLFGLTHGFDAPEAGRIGSLCAAEIISHYGARPIAVLSNLV